MRVWFVASDGIFLHRVGGLVAFEESLARFEMALVILGKFQGSIAWR